MDKMIIKFPDAGDLFEPLPMSDAEPRLILPGFQFWDVGLMLNEREGDAYYKPDEIIQFHGFVRGVEVWIEMTSGRYGLDGRSGYRVAFGSHPDYPPMVDVREAARLIRENVPPVEYVKVTPEEWAHRRDS